MGAEDDLEYDEDVSVVKLPVRTKWRLEDPRWEVRFRGEAIGWIQQKHLRGASNTFFFATGIHPENGREYRLEGNIDFRERVQVIVDFHRDPMTSRQHL